MKILVVDDDHEIVELLSIYLKNEGYEPIAAYNGKEALTKLSTTPRYRLDDSGRDDAEPVRHRCGQGSSQGF